MTNPDRRFDYSHVHVSEGCSVREVGSGWAIINGREAAKQARERRKQRRAAIVTVIFLLAIAGASLWMTIQIWAAFLAWL